MATKTLGLTGRDYSTFSAYSSYVNALTFSANEFCDVYNDGEIVDSVSVGISGYNANGFALAIRAVNGHSFADHANKLTNPLRYNASVGVGLSNSAEYSIGYQLTGANLTVTGLQFKTSVSISAGVFQLSNGVVLNRVIAKHVGGSTIFVQSGSGGAVLNDSLFYTSGSGAASISAASLVVDGCTFAKTGGATTNGFTQDYPVSPIVRNTVVFGFLTDFANAAGSGTTNNATDQASFGGTGWGVNGQVLVTAGDFESVTTGSEDFRIKTTSTKLPALGAVGAGSGFSVIGIARSGTAPAISAWEPSSGGSAATGVTATGPSGGVVNVQSTNFNIGVTPTGGTITGTVIVTPSSGGGGGSFTPATVSLTTASPTATLTYTPTSTGVKVISFTNNGGLTNPNNINYTVTNGGAGLATSDAFKNNTGAVLSGATIPRSFLIKLSDIPVTNRVTNGAGILSFSDAAIAPGTPCLLITYGDGSNFGCEPVTTT